MQGDDREPGPATGVGDDSGDPGRRAGGLEEAVAGGDGAARGERLATEYPQLAPEDPSPKPWPKGSGRSLDAASKTPEKPCKIKQWTRVRFPAPPPLTS